MNPELNVMNSESDAMNPELTKYLVVFCTCASAEMAHKLAHVIIARHCAACVNILPHLTSVYRWEDKITTADEFLLMIKTSAARYPELENLLRSEHNYQIPEIIALPIQNGLPSYLNWIQDSIA